MVKMRIEELSRQLTAQEEKELETAAALPQIFDEDSPEMTPDKLAQFRKAPREERIKQTVSLRLSPKTLKLAKSYGKGYTSFLSRLLDEAIRDESLVRRCM